MKQTVTIEIEDTTVLQLLKNLAAMSLVRFKQEISQENNQLTDHLNKIYSEEESSLDPCLILAQTQAIDKEDW